MLNRSKVSPLVREYAAERGWTIFIVSQPIWLFPDDGRRLKRVAISSDPWWAYLERNGCTVQGVGVTADDAVLAAVPRGLSESLRLCELEVDNLRGCLVEVTSRGNIRA